MAINNSKTNSGVLASSTPRYGGKGFVFTSDAVLAIVSVGVLLGIIYSFLSMPVQMHAQNHFGDDILSVIERTNASESDIAFMFDSASKCGSVSSVESETGQVPENNSGSKTNWFYSGCLCSESQDVSVTYGIIPPKNDSPSTNDSSPLMVRIESCMKA